MLATILGHRAIEAGYRVYYTTAVILEGDLEGSAELEREVREHVAQRIGKLARPKRIIWTADVPKTRSGKIIRRLLRDIAEGRELGDVTTLREPGVMKDLETKFAEDER
jgi:acetyl-CoA synthetase